MNLKQKLLIWIYGILGFIGLAIFFSYPIISGLDGTSPAPDWWMALFPISGFMFACWFVCIFIDRN
jgi:ABC-type antimicrobial peptide transport system permease subunit